MLVLLRVGKPTDPGRTHLAEISHDPATVKRWHATACAEIGLDWANVSAAEVGVYTAVQANVLRKAGIRVHRDEDPYAGPALRAWDFDGYELDHHEIWLLLAQWQAAREGVHLTWSFPPVHEIETGGDAYSA